MAKFRQAPDRHEFRRSKRIGTDGFRNADVRGNSTIPVFMSTRRRCCWEPVPLDCRRHPVARSRPFPRLRHSLRLAAEWPVRHREHRQHRPDAGQGGNPRHRRTKAPRWHRRPGARHRPDLTSAVAAAASRCLDWMPVGVLNACRNNPFEAGGTRDIGFSRGVARVAAPEGVLSRSRPVRRDGDTLFILARSSAINSPEVRRR